MTSAMNAGATAANNPVTAKPAKAASPATTNIGRTWGTEKALQARFSGSGRWDDQNRDRGQDRQAICTTNASRSG